MGQRDWSALVIVARDGGIFARLAMNAGPVWSLPLAVEIDWAVWARLVEDQSHQLPRLIEAWKDEYSRNIRFAEEVHDNQTPPAPMPSRHHRLFDDDEVAVVLPQARQSARQLQRL